MNQSTHKLEEIALLLDSIYPKHQSQQIEVTIDTILEQVKQLKDDVVKERNHREAFFEHLQECMAGNYFSHFPHETDDEDLNLLSLGFNTFLEELEGNMVTKDNFELIFNSITFQIIVFDHQNEIRFINSCAKLFFRRETLETINDLGFPDLVSEILAFKKSKQKSVEFVQSWDIQQENACHINYKLIKINFEGKKQVLIIGEDITNQKEDEMRMLRATYYGQDIERKRLAKDLHDSLGQELNAIKMHINASLTMSTNSADYEKIIAKTSKIINDSVKSIQEVCFNLHPSHLDSENFVAAIKGLTERLSHVGPDFIVSSNLNVIQIVNKKHELFVFRIIQEFLNNSIKYAEAQTIYVILKYYKKVNLLVLRMVDDGKGFDMETTTLNNGIHNIRQRLNALNANYEYKSALGKGTELTFSMNLRKEN